MSASASRHLRTYPEPDAGCTRQDLRTADKGIVEGLEPTICRRPSRHAIPNTADTRRSLSVWWLGFQQERLAQVRLTFIDTLVSPCACTTGAWSFA